MKEHSPLCQCGCQEGFFPEGQSRKSFLKKIGALTMGMGLAPVSAMALSSETGHSEEIQNSGVIKKGKATQITLLHTSDIHGQVNVHDEFFWKNEQPHFEKRGGFAHLKTLIDEVRKQNPNTLLLDGGDCFQGSAIASLSEGRALIPLMNNLGYNLMLPGNWEVMYGKEMLMTDMGGYNAPKVCSNMRHENGGDLIFPPYQTFFIGGIKIGFVGYNDPLTGIRQPPAYSVGITFQEPEQNMARYVKYLKEKEKCQMVFAMTHMGMSQQLRLANQDFTEGVDYILGADTHERIREPLQGKYAKVTEPGAFASFVGRLDLVVEDGKIKDEAYTLMDVDPEKYKANKEMERLLEAAHEPYRKKIRQVIGKSKTVLQRYYIMETPMDNMITDALMWKGSVDITFSNGFRFCPPLVPYPSRGEAEITRDFLWSMIPFDAKAQTAVVSGKQLKNWLERELENVFAKDPTKRFGGWLVRFQGMTIKFTIGNEAGQRLQEILIKGKPLEENADYVVLACEREGDPDDVLCRIKNVRKRRDAGFTLHEAIEGYLKVHSPVSPKLENRAVATDAPATLLTQAIGVAYQFR